jgi:hypothetical protein
MTLRSPRRRRPAILSRLERLVRLMRSNIRIRPSATTWQPVISLEPSVRLLAPEPAEGLLAGRLELLELGGELTRTLDRHAMSRSVMPALALLERALAGSSGRGVGRLSAPVLWDAINHINVLSDSWQGSGLSVLRRRLSTALGMDDADVDVLCASTQSMQVGEARLSDFMEVMDEWSRSADATAERRAEPVAH